ncbi:MAG: hypothetical protein ACI9XR_002721, partial [Flavobacterium sp.]
TCNEKFPLESFISSKLGKNDSLQLKSSFNTDG